MTTTGLYNLAVDNLVRGLAGMPVVDNAAARRRVSLEVQTKTALPWRRQLATALDSLDLRADLVSRVSTRQRLVFRQDGRPLAASRFDLGSMSIRADVDGYRYELEHQPLEAAILTLLGNSSLRHDARDTVVFEDPASGTRDLFRTPVDIEFHNADGSWEANLAFLHERFGVTLEVLAESVTRQEIELVEVAPAAGVRHGD